MTPVIVPILYPSPASSPRAACTKCACATCDCSCHEEAPFPFAAVVLGVVFLAIILAGMYWTLELKDWQKRYQCPVDKKTYSILNTVMSDKPGRYWLCPDHLVDTVPVVERCRQWPFEPCEVKEIK